MLSNTFEKTIFKELNNAKGTVDPKNVDRMNLLMKQALGVISDKNHNIDSIQKLKELIENNGEWTTRKKFISENSKALATYLTFNTYWNQTITSPLANLASNENTLHFYNEIEKMTQDQKSRIENKFGYLLDISKINIDKWTQEEISDLTVNNTEINKYTIATNNIKNFLEKIKKIFIDNFNWELFKRGTIDLTASYKYENNQFKFTRKYKIWPLQSKQTLFNLDRSNAGSTAHLNNGFDYQTWYDDNNFNGEWKTPDAHYPVAISNSKDPNGIYPGYKEIGSDFWAICRLVKMEKTIAKNILSELVKNDKRDFINENTYKDLYEQWFDSEQSIFRGVQLIQLLAHSHEKQTHNNRPVEIDTNTIQGKDIWHLGSPRLRDFYFWNHSRANTPVDTYPKDNNGFYPNYLVVNKSFEKEWGKTGLPFRFLSSGGLVQNYYDRYVYDTIGVNMSIKNVGNNSDIQLDFCTTLRTDLRHAAGQQAMLSKPGDPFYKAFFGDGTNYLLNNHEYAGWFDNDLSFTK